MLIKAGQFVGRRWDNRGGSLIEARVYGGGAAGGGKTHGFECRANRAGFYLAVAHLNRIPHAFWCELAERPDAEAFVPDFVAAFVRARVTDRAKGGRHVGR